MASQQNVIFAGPAGQLEGMLHLPDSAPHAIAVVAHPLPTMGGTTDNRAFWWISIFGALISLIYAVGIQNTVFTLAKSLALVPYARNLMLLRHGKVIPLGNDKRPTQSTK